MKNAIRTHAAQTKDAAPWLYSVGNDLLLDLNSYPSRRDWLALKAGPMILYHLGRYFIAAMIVLGVLLALLRQEGMTDMLMQMAIAVTVGSLVSYFWARHEAKKLRSDLVVVRQDTQMGTELLRLGHYVSNHPKAQDGDNALWLMVYGELYTALRNNEFTASRVREIRNSARQQFDDAPRTRSDI